MQSKHGESEAALSVVTIVELTHGIYRAKTDAERERRRAFSEQLRRDMVVHPVTVEIAKLAGRIEGEQAAKGVRITFEDLLIGATALHIPYTVLTINATNSGAAHLRAATPGAMMRRASIRSGFLFCGSCHVKAADALEI